MLSEYSDSEEWRFELMLRRQQRYLLHKLLLKQHAGYSTQRGEWGGEMFSGEGFNQLKSKRERRVWDSAALYTPLGAIGSAVGQGTGIAKAVPGK